jgi:threonine/homoserine/homoserine lactone efflux protein
MTSEILAFSGVAAGVIVMPGADLAVVLRNGLTARRAGLATGIGIVCGLALHTMLAALGLAALLVTSDLLFLVVKLMGSAYLLYLGGKALLACMRAGRQAADPEDEESGRPRSNTASRTSAMVASDTRLRPYLVQGFITNAANPKAPILFLSLMPQFIPNDAPFLPMTLLLSGIVILAGLVWFPFVATLASSVGRFLGSPLAGRIIDGVIGTVLICLSVVLLLESAS